VLRLRLLPHRDLPHDTTSGTEFVIEFESVPRSPDKDTASLWQLTESEREVALVVAEGLSNEEAAARLGTTIHAVKFL
jgi:DNA-binding NarL/FixJ family response regulator